MGSAGRPDGLADLVAGMGSATPAPLFFIDESGHAHALNELAEALPDDHGSAEAYLSPVAAGPERRGHVVAYVDPTMPGAPGEVVAAMVALTAEVVGRRLRAPREAGLPLAPSEATLELALARLNEVTEVDGISEVVVGAVASILGAERVVACVRRPDGTFEARASRGMRSTRLRRIRPGVGLLGWAAARFTPTEVASAYRLPQGAPRDEGRHGPLATWLTAPFLLVPLCSGAQVVGLLCVSGLASRPGRDAAKEAGARIQRLTERAGSALAGALMLRQARREERVHRELEIARHIQRRLLAGRPVEYSGLQLAGDCRAASQVGGDWYGFRASADGTLIAALFDVAGHGIGAAFCMTLVRSALRAELARGGTPGEVLGRTNELATEDLSESGLFATAFLARFDRASGRVEYASAGHSRPIHWSAKHRAFRSHREAGLPLGLFGDSHYTEGSAPFDEGDFLVLYTDGIVEAANAKGEQFGRERLMAAVRRLRRKPARVVLKALWRHIERFAGGVPLRDDATLVIVRGDRGFGARVSNRGERGRGSSVEAAEPASSSQRDAERNETWMAGSTVGTGIGR